MIRPIVTWPDPVLTTPTRAVARFGTARLRKLVADMWETMYAAPGVGLAANQIGVALRVAVVDSTSDGGGRIFEMVNPVITQRGPLVPFPGEACLSVPEERHDTRRHATVTLEYRTLEGEPKLLLAEGFTAVVIQHEVDHLDGKVYLHLLSALKREQVRRRAGRARKPRKS